MRPDPKVAMQSVFDWTITVFGQLSTHGRSRALMVAFDKTGLLALMKIVIILLFFFFVIFAAVALKSELISK